MKLLFKQILYISVIGLFFLPMMADASTLKVERFSSPIKLANKISQPINLSFATDGNWKLLVESFDSQIRNQDNPNFSIPITRLELAEVGGMPISSFETGKIIEIKNSNTSGINNINIALNVINKDCDKPGNYVADVKFTLINQNTVVAEDIYSFRFRQEEISSIDFSKRIVNLSMPKDKILQKGSKQNLTTPLGLYISSNKDWKLYIRNLSNSNDKTLSYFVRVLGGDYSVNCNTTNEYVPISETPILLASGKSTTNEMMGCLDKRLISIDYQVKGPDDRLIKAGSRSEDFEYRLETEN